MAMNLTALKLKLVKQFGTDVANSWLRAFFRKPGICNLCPKQCRLLPFGTSKLKVMQFVNINHAAEHMVVCTVC